MSEFKSFKSWQRHVDKLLKYNHATISVPSGKPSYPAAHKATILDTLKANRKDFLASNASSVSIQYSFKHSSFSSSNFLSAEPQFQPKLDLSVRNLPCILFLHGSTPGGFDMSRWMASGVAQIHNIWDPVSKYSALNLFDTNLTNLGAISSSSQAQISQTPNKYDYFKSFKPGYSNNQTNAHTFQDQLPQFFPLGLLCISRPGYLESTPSIENTFHSEALSIIRLLDNLSIRSIRIVAHGLSALVAMDLASLPNFRDRVQGIALIDPILTNSKAHTNMLYKSKLIPSFIKNRYYYSKIKKGPESPEFKNFIAEACGPLAKEEMDSDIGMSTLYEYLGLLFSSYECRNQGVESDKSKLAHFFNNYSQIRKQWTFINSPILVANTSSTLDEYNYNKFNSESEYLEEQQRSVLLNTGSSALQFKRILGGGGLLYPVGEVSTVILDFLRNHGFIV
ncbi:hypothetical protein BB561_002400 [Smittium simulii]|uniref:AB hydrolase-1 domain-containing protein n=1 Tax=Smittium simulii TaxID=133385 RepID=A0A2T9YQJ4_9FUNG|nr:hypothetical protein BB561_002400 [Smittium simulii]